jgi:hypothetical protein
VSKRKRSRTDSHLARLLSGTVGALGAWLLCAMTFGPLPWQLLVSTLLLAAVVTSRTRAQASWMGPLVSLWFGYMLARTWVVDEFSSFSPMAVPLALSAMALVSDVWLVFRATPAKPARAWMRFPNGVEVPLRLVPSSCARCDCNAAEHYTAFAVGPKVLVSGDYEVVFCPPRPKAVVTLYGVTDDGGRQWCLPLPAEAS